jgi:hypothetical protein
MASVDKNLPALLDEQAYTVECMYNKSPKRYTFVANMQPRLRPGDTVLVTEAGTVDTEAVKPVTPEVQLARKFMHEAAQQARVEQLTAREWAIRSGNSLAYASAKRTLDEFRDAEDSDAFDGSIPASIRTPNLVAVRVMEVHDRVQIEPGAEFAYKWIVARVDTAAWFALQARNRQIMDAYADAYKNNLRRSFASQVLGQLDDATAGNIKALLAAPTAPAAHSATEVKE